MIFQFFWHKVCLFFRNMTLYTILHTLWSIVGIIYVFRGSFSPASAWAWSLAMIIAPPISTLALWLTRCRTTFSPRCSHAPHYNRLQRSIATLALGELTTRNHITALHNAEQTYTSLIRDLQHARREIIFEFYIIDDDHIGSTILALLCRRARSGVKVKIIYDAVGSWRLSKKSINTLKQSGIELQRFGPPRFPYLSPDLHRRNHRKIVLIDREILYVGGINIASRYLGEGRLGYWRDDHIRIEGEAAQKAIRQIAPTRKDSFRRRTTASLCPMQFIYPSQQSPTIAMQYIFQEAFSSARHSIRISTPYFLPPASLLDSICSAAQSGVEVTLIIPSRSDIALIDCGSMPSLRRAVASGVKLFRYKDGFLHSKVIIIDDSTSIIGSANMDYRSLRYNLEAAAVAYNKGLARHYMEQFMQDVAHSTAVVPRDLHSSFLGRIKEGAAQLIAPLL